MLLQGGVLKWENYLAKRRPKNPVKLIFRGGGRGGKNDHFGGFQNLGFGQGHTWPNMTFIFYLTFLYKVTQKSSHNVTCTRKYVWRRSLSQYRCLVKTPSKHAKLSTRTYVFHCSYTDLRVHKNIIYTSRFFGGTGPSAGNDPFDKVLTQLCMPRPVAKLPYHTLTVACNELAPPLVNMCHI